MNEKDIKDEDIDIEKENSEDIIVERELDDANISDSAENKVAKIKADLSVCKKDKQEYMDGWQRAKADYVNLLKRTEESIKSAELKGKIKTVETLFPAFDALERSKEHSEIPEGFIAIARQIESAFAELGLEEIGKVGEEFDPMIHDALGQDEVESTDEDNKVTVLLEKGWRIDDTIIRPAKVRVATAKTFK